MKNRKSSQKVAREKIYFPGVMTKTILAATANSTYMYFDFNHICHEYNALFAMEHVERYDEITGCSNIRRFIKNLNEQNIRY